MKTFLSKSFCRQWALVEFEAAALADGFADIPEFIQRDIFSHFSIGEDIERVERVRDNSFPVYNNPLPTLNKRMAYLYGYEWIAGSKVAKWSLIRRD